MLLKLLRPGGVKAVSAENILLRQQLITLKRRHKCSPKLTLSERLNYGLLTSLVSPRRLSKIAVIIKPSTLLKFHKALVERKYRFLFSNKSKQKPGPKGPSQELINLVIEMKKRNPSFGYLRIAMQIKGTFGMTIDKGIVKRILDKYTQLNTGNDLHGLLFLVR